MIARTRLRGKFELITQSGAATAQYAQAQSARNAFSSERLTDFLDGFRRYMNPRLPLCRRFRDYAKLSELSHGSAR